MNRKLIIALGAAALLSIGVVAAAFAAGPYGAGAGTGTGTYGAGAGHMGGGATAGQVVTGVLNLTQEQIAELRQSGLSLAQIAERQGVDVQVVIDAITGQVESRITARVEAGALTQEQADALTAQVQARVEAMVDSTEPGGLQGAAVGAGPAARQGGHAFGGQRGAMGAGQGAGLNGPCATDTAQ